MLGNEELKKQFDQLNKNTGAAKSLGLALAGLGKSVLSGTPADAVSGVVGAAGTGAGVAAPSFSETHPVLDGIDKTVSFVGDAASAIGLFAGDALPVMAGTALSATSAIAGVAALELALFKMTDAATSYVYTSPELADACALVGLSSMDASSNIQSVANSMLTVGQSSQVGQQILEGCALGIQSTQSALTQNILENAGLQGEAALAGMQSFTQLYDQLLGYNRTQLDVVSGTQKSVQSYAESIRQTGEMTESQAVLIMGNAQRTRDSVIQTAEEQFQQEIGILQEKLNSEAGMSQAAYDIEFSAAVGRKNAAIKNANETYDETTRITQEGYLQQNEGLQGSLTDMMRIYGEMKQAKQDELAGFEECNNSWKDQAIDRWNVESDYNLKMRDLSQQLTECLDGDTQSQLGFMLSLSDNTALSTEDMSGDLESFLGTLAGDLQQMGYLTEDFQFLEPVAESTSENTGLINSNIENMRLTSAEDLQKFAENGQLAGEGLVNNLSGAIEEGGPFITEQTQGLTECVTAPIQGIPEASAGAIAGTFTQMDGELAENQPWFLEGLSAFASGSAMCIGSMPSMVGTPVADTITGLNGQVDANKESFWGNLSGMMTNGVGLINGAPDLLGTPLTSIFGLLTGQIDNGQGSLLGKMAGLAGGTTGQLNNMPNLLGNPMGFMLSALLAVANGYTDLFSNGSSQLVTNITKPFSSMPAQSSGLMSNFLSPMLTAMNNAAPGLFSTAANIASGILTRLRRSFDIHSPSRKTRAIFQNVMEGAELGLSDRTEALYGQTEDIASGVMDNLRGLASRARATVAREMGGAQPAALWGGAASRLDALAGRGEELGLFRQMAEGLHKGGTRVEADLVLDGQTFGRLVTRLSDRGLGNRMRNTARLGVDVT